MTNQPASAELRARRADARLYLCTGARRDRGPARPWLATGGITLGRLDEVCAAGAARVVAGRAITEADGPAAVHAFSQRLRGLARQQ